MVSRGWAAGPSGAAASLTMAGLHLVAALSIMVRTNSFIHLCEQPIFL